jgi:hypothetical protein
VRSRLVAFVLALAGCSDEPSTPAETAPAADAGPPPIGCKPGETTLPDASCLAAGIPEDGCAAGFEPTGDGSCAPVMPAATCESGHIAVPGDTSCRPVAPCEEGRWGGVPIEPDTVYVDAGWVGTEPSDGSEERPYRTMQEGVDAAPHGAIVAVAAGTYAEDVLVASPVRIWGRCPELVEVVGTGASIGALELHGGSDHSEVHRIAVRGANTGIFVIGAEEIVLDQLWVHDTEDRGIDVERGFGATSVLVKDTLVERTTELGVFVSGTEVTIASSAIRSSQPIEGQFGRAIQVQRDPADGQRGHVTVIGSALQHNHEISIYNASSDVRVEGSWIHDTREGAVTRSGWGIAAQVDDAGAARPSLEVIASVVDGSLQTGVYVSGGHLLVERTVVRNVAPTVAQVGVRGISVELALKGTDRGMALVRSSLIERCHGAGLAALGADATVESTRVRDSLPNDDETVGRGVQAQTQRGQAGHITLRSSVVERSGDAGVFAVASTVIAEDVLIDQTMGVGDSFGDGLAALWLDAPAHIELSRTMVRQSNRAGVSNFASSVVIRDTTLECNPIQLDAEKLIGIEATFEDGGGNVCGCEGELESCQVLSSSLVPPEPLGT